MRQTPPLQHSILGTFVLPVAQALRRFGIDPLELMAEVGIDGAKLANPDWRIPNDRFGALMARSVEASEDEAFGLLAAQQIQPAVLHGLGLAWLASDTVYDGLRRLVRFGKLVSTSTRMRMWEEGEFVVIDLGDTPLADQGYHALRDYAAGSVARMCTLALGEYLAPVLVSLDRPPPTAPDRWAALLCSQVAFDAPTCTLQWYRSDILEPLVTGDPALARANDEATQSHLDSFLNQSTARQVVDKILEMLPDGPPAQHDVAAALHLSNRTLQRKLRDEDTSFSDLLQDTRLQLARKYLRQHSRSVVETAYLLGFSEPSTFSRAFKRWTGVAPADFREATGEEA
ncbi:AraC family transcriptional regulator [Mangrovimicrobium sediminis]|nr:AraC family transcriptional regulator [Haliea sp. SAOS-164]